MKRIFLNYYFLSFVIVGFIGLSSIEIKAQAPTSIAGRAVVLTITSAINNGETSFASSGSYLFLPSATGNTYAVIGDGVHVANSYGTFTYAGSGSQGAINFNDSGIGVPAVSLLTFTSATAGTFVNTVPSVPGVSQWGTFSAYSGLAPASIQGWTFQSQVEAGVSPYASSGSAQLVTTASGNNYQITGGPGVLSSSGTYVYTQNSAYASSATLDDSIIGPEYTQTLSWKTPTTGVYLVRNVSTGGFQAGTFVGTPPPTSLFFQNGTSLGILSLNRTFLPNIWMEVGGMSSGWQERAIADINGNGVSDIIFQNGTLIGALMLDASGHPSSWVGIGSMSAGWQLRGAADITDDGNLDFIFQNGTLLGYLEINSSGQPVSWTGIGAMGTGWELRAVASLDGTGQPDLIFQNGTLLGALKVNTSGVPTAWVGIGAMGAGWTLSDAVDVNGDGQPDLIFENGTTLGALQVNTSFQPVTWHGIGAMGSGWTLPGDY